MKNNQKSKQAKAIPIIHSKHIHHNNLQYQPLPEKLVDYLRIVKELNPSPSSAVSSSSSFSNYISTDADTLLFQHDSKSRVFWERGGGEEKEKIKECMNINRISAKDHDYSHNYDYCFRVKVSPQACLPLRVPLFDDEMMDDTNKLIRGRSARSHTNKKIFPLSGIIALIDDLTTYATIIKDSKSRPGISIHLSASLTPYGLMNLPTPGNELDVYVKVVKIGKRLGFLDAFVVCTDTNCIIATGKHTKFLDVGFGAVEGLGTVGNIASNMPSSSLDDFTPVSPSFEGEGCDTNHMLPDKHSETTTRGRKILNIQEDLFKFEFNHSNELDESGKLYLKPEHMNPMGSFHVSGSIHFSRYSELK